MFRLNEIAPLIDAENPQARVGTLRAWFSRGILRYTGEDRAPAKAGSVGLLSPFRVVQVALTVRLADLMLTPKEAADAAFRFSDLSGMGRLPSGLFARGRTLLAAYRTRDGTLRSKVLNERPGESFESLMFRLVGEGQPIPHAVIVIDCAEVLRELEPLLGAPLPYPASERT